MSTPRILKLLGIIICGAIFAQRALAMEPLIEGTNLLTGASERITAANKQGMVVVFLSAVCPCSNSHIPELRKLAQENPDYQFVAVHSNTNEGSALSRPYFEKLNLGFPIVEDPGAKIADQFHALKTPHAYLLSANGEILYQGGVSSSRDFERADQKFLREAIVDVKSKHAVRTPRGRTLGCLIYRGLSHGN